VLVLYDYKSKSTVLLKVQSDTATIFGWAILSHTRVSVLRNWLSLFGSNPQLCQLLSTTLAALDLFC